MVSSENQNPYFLLAFPIPFTIRFCQIIGTISVRISPPSKFLSDDIFLSDWILSNAIKRFPILGESEYESLITWGRQLHARWPIDHERMRRSTVRLFFFVLDFSSFADRQLFRGIGNERARYRSGRWSGKIHGRADRRGQHRSEHLARRYSSIHAFAHEQTISSGSSSRSSR